MKKIGIIGAGRIVNWFLTDLKNANSKNEFELFGIWNISFEKAQSVANDYGIQNVFATIEELLASENKLDLIYVGTIDEKHYYFIKQALIAKINVFSEKPLALKYEEAQELYQLANANQVLLFEGIKTGFAPAFKKAQTIIESQKLGQVRYLYASHAKVSTSGRIPNPSSEVQIAGFHQAGGMYALYTALAICGPGKIVNYFNNSYPQNAAIQTSILAIRHHNGAISTVVGSDAFTDDLATKIMLDHGYIKLGGRVDQYNADYQKDSAHLPYTISVYDNQNNLLTFEDLKITTQGEGLHLEIDHVYDLLTNNKTQSNVVTPDLSLEIIKILTMTNQVNDFAVINLDEELV